MMEDDAVLYAEVKGAKDGLKGGPWDPPFRGEVFEEGLLAYLRTYFWALGGAQVIREVDLPGH